MNVSKRNIIISRCPCVLTDSDQVSRNDGHYQEVRGRLRREQSGRAGGRIVGGGRFENRLSHLGKG